MKPIGAEKQRQNKDEKGGGKRKAIKNQTESAIDCIIRAI
jgi:hypothetical protein